MTREYVRVYYELVDDEKFDGLGLDGLGAWLRLLLLADATWPASAFLPSAAVVPDDLVDDLTLRGIVDRLPGGRFRIHGLDKERDYRRSTASRGSAARWSSERIQHPNASAMQMHSKRIQHPNAPASDTNMPSRAKTSKDETSSHTRSREGLANLDDSVAAAWEDATGRTVLASGNWAATYLDDAARRHGASKVTEAIVTARGRFGHIPEPTALAAAVRQVLDPLPDAKAAAVADRADDAAREAAARDARNQRTLAKAKHNSGLHADTRDAACPLCQEVAP